MKVNDPYTTSSSPVDLVTHEATRRSAQKTGSSAGTDRVQLSGDLRLAKAAVQAATVQPEIRQEVVDRAKALLESGELDRDVERLADAIIADLTVPYDDNPS